MRNIAKDEIEMAAKREAMLDEGFRLFAENGIEPVPMLTCTKCGETDEEAFAEHLNDTDCEELDINSDGIVNGKDYAYLIQL